jgi:hypothetical protein
MEEEERRSLAKPTVRMNVPREIQTEDEVSTSIIVLIGKKPTKVSKSREGEFEIVLPDFSDTEKMLSYNGKMFKNTSMEVKVARVEKVLEVEEIFLLVTQKLTLKDRQDLFQHANQPSTWGRQRTRSVSMDSKEGASKKSPGEGKRSSPLVKEICTPAPKLQSQSAPSTPVREESLPAASNSQPPQAASNPTTPSQGKGFGKPLAGTWPVTNFSRPWNFGGRGPQSSWQGTQWRAPNFSWKGQPNFGKGSTFGKGDGWVALSSKGTKGKGKGDNSGKGKGRGKGEGRG